MNKRCSSRTSRGLNVEPIVSVEGEKGRRKGRYARVRYAPRDPRKMSLYRFSKGGRLFVQGTREDDNRDGVSPSPTGSRSADDLQAVYTKRRLSTEVLGSKSKSGDRRERIRSDDRAAPGSTSGRQERVVALRVILGCTRWKSRRWLSRSRDDFASTNYQLAEKKKKKN